MAASWLRDAVIYEIFVDRFAKCDSTRTCHRFASWESSPSPTTFMGGNLAGIGERLDYLEDLGVNVLYLTPIFLSTSNHRYHTCDYFRIDPRLGTLRDFRRLLAGAHQRGMRLVLDGVFNHCGRGFFPFVDVLENGKDSAWIDWFHIAGFPVDAYGQSRARGWLGAAEVPEINLAHPAAREYMLRVADFWTRQGIDGWRLDAVAHVQHRDFWREFRDVVNRLNPDAYILAEIWEDPTPWLEDSAFDGATNYALRNLLIEFVFARTTPASVFAARLQALLARHSTATCYAMCNLLGSHDTPRLWHVAGGDMARLKMAWALLFALPGVPSVYYGDEIGLDGGSDPDNRRTFTWDRSRWNSQLLSIVSTWTRLRRSTEALRGATWETMAVDDERDICVFSRQSSIDHVLVLAHRGTVEQRYDCIVTTVGLAPEYVDVLTGQVYAVCDRVLHLEGIPPETVMLLKPIGGRAGLWTTGTERIERI